MDLIESCRVLVEIEQRGSVTAAASALGIAQSVASRRVQNLGARIGGALLERSPRNATLTPLGREVVISARRLVRLADDVLFDAERALLHPVTIAVPEACATRDLAVAVAAGRASGHPVEFERASPGRRAEWTATRTVAAAVVAVPSDGSRWRVPLGAAGRRRVEGELRIDALRPGRRGGTRGRDAGARLRITSEDEVPHVRDVLTRAGFAAGLLPRQLPSDASTTEALAAVLADDDLLLCSAAEARQLGLHWRPLAGIDLSRGYAVSTSGDQRAIAATEAIDEELAAALGADPHSASGTRRADG